MIINRGKVEIEEMLNTNSTQLDLTEYNNKYNKYIQLKEEIEKMYLDLGKFAEGDIND